MKINWQSIVLWAIGVMITAIFGLTSVIYMNSVKTDEKISSLLKEHSDKISTLEVKVAVIEHQLNFISTDSKKNKLTCNIRQYLCVNNFLSKKKKQTKDAYDSEDDVPLFI